MQNISLLEDKPSESDNAQGRTRLRRFLIVEEQKDYLNKCDQG